LLKRLDELEAAQNSTAPVMFDVFLGKILFLELHQLLAIFFKL